MVADKAVIAELLLPMLVASVLDTVAILLLIDVIALACVAIDVAIVALRAVTFVLVLLMLVAIVADNAVRSASVGTPDVEITRLALILIPEPAVYTRAELNNTNVMAVVPNVISPTLLHT